jgi:hypothetical protein
MGIDMSPIIGMFLKQVGWSKEKFETFTGAIEEAIRTHAETQREILNTVRHVDFMTQSIMNEVCKSPLTGSMHQDYADAGLIQLQAEIEKTIGSIDAQDHLIDKIAKGEYDGR